MGNRCVFRPLVGLLGHLDHTAVQGLGGFDDVATRIPPAYDRLSIAVTGPRRTRSFARKTIKLPSARLIRPAGGDRFDLGVPQRRDPALRLIQFFHVSAGCVGSSKLWMLSAYLDNPSRRLQERLFVFLSRLQVLLYRSVPDFCLATAIHRAMLPPQPSSRPRLLKVLRRGGASLNRSTST